MGTITKRGFDYIIQDTEPTGEEDNIVEVLETAEEGSSFDYEEFSLDVKELYNLKQDTIWWFRTICYQISPYTGEVEKVTADSWMKNVPTVETKETLNNQLILNCIPRVKVFGNITDKGANAVTKRGFRLFKEYRGSKDTMDNYIQVGTVASFDIAGETKSKTITNELLEVIDYYWLGLFYRDNEEEGDFDLGEFSAYFGGGSLGEGMFYELYQNDTYLYQAFAENELGRAYGEMANGNTVISLVHDGELAWCIAKDYGAEMMHGLPPKNICGKRYANVVEGVNYSNIRIFTTLGNDGGGITVEDEQISETLFEKTVTLGTIPSGTTVTRIGINLGRTVSCNELHYFKDGSWTSGQSYTFLVELEPNSKYYIMPYYVVDFGSYEKKYLGMLNYTDPEERETYLEKFPVEITDDMTDLDLNKEVISGGSGSGITYSYRSIVNEIICEKVGEQGLIDYYGRRRSYQINNHLIQTKAACCSIATDYVNKFQRLKLKVVIEIDMPIPFEREDTILLGYGGVLYKVAEEHIVDFKENGNGQLSGRPYILAKIRKMDVSYNTNTEAILTLELEV